MNTFTPFLGWVTDWKLLSGVGLYKGTLCVVGSLLVLCTYIPYIGNIHHFCCTHSEDETTSAVNTMRITFDNEYPSPNKICIVCRYSVYKASVLHM